MARVKAEYFNAKDKATGEIKEIQFIPPAPSDGDLGGISQEKLEQIDELKSDLSDKLPKSPAEWEPWTSDEQAVARERMGFHNAFELLVSQELTETVVNISFDFGKTVNEIYMLCKSPKVTAVSPCQWKNQNAKTVGSWTSNVLSTSTERYVMTHFSRIDGLLRTCEVRFGTNNQAANLINTSYHDYDYGISKLMGTYANGFMAGTIFTVWGR